LQDFLGHLPELRKLTSFKHEFSDIIDFFPKLQALEFSISSSDDENSWPSLYRLHNLTSLAVNFDKNYEGKDRELGTVARWIARQMNNGCRHLETVEIGSRGVSMEGVEELTKVLKETPQT
jgi:sulfite reductase alpha subunit-like flavoprotein